MKFELPPFWRVAFPIGIWCSVPRAFNKFARGLSVRTRFVAVSFHCPPFLWPSFLSACPLQQKYYDARDHHTRKETLPEFVRGSHFLCKVAESCQFLLGTADSLFGRGALICFNPEPIIWWAPGFNVRHRRWNSHTEARLWGIQREIIAFYIITQVILVFWLVLAQDLFEDRPIDEDSAGSSVFFFNFLNFESEPSTILC